MRATSKRMTVAVAGLAAVGLIAASVDSASATPPPSVAIAKVTPRGDVTGGSSSAPSSSANSINVEFIKVDDLNNPGVGIIPFTDAIYRTCADAPTPSKCRMVGRVAHKYGIAKLEVSVADYVAFLNTVDPHAENAASLYTPRDTGTRWPKFGQINIYKTAKVGHRYALAQQEWANKPFGFATWVRAARFVNSLTNGTTVHKSRRSEGGVTVVTKRIRFSSNTETGMYDLRLKKPRRTKNTGFVIPSQNEWIKAAYYDRSGGGTYSYWKYPTNAGVFGDGDATAPQATVANPTNGDVTNSATQPIASLHPSGGSPPSWCPAAISPAVCNTKNPLALPPDAYQAAFQGSLTTRGQALTKSPYGTLDQGGNAVEWTDTLAAPATGSADKRVWRRLHGGVSNAPAYQLWLSATGLQPQNNTFYVHRYPWLGFRLAVIGDLAPR